MQYNFQADKPVLNATVLASAQPADASLPTGVVGIPTNITDWRIGAVFLVALLGKPLVNFIMDLIKGDRETEAKNSDRLYGLLERMMLDQNQRLDQLNATMTEVKISLAKLNKDE